MTNPKGIEKFHDIHSGETCLILGNGPGLGDLPLWFLQSYPSFGSNLIYKLEGFKPTYYATCDSYVMRNYWDEIKVIFAEVPKFIPTPNLDKWDGENVYRWKHRPGPLWPNPKAGKLWPRSVLSDEGITYISVTHVLLQLAYFMGFTQILCVGLDNTDNKQHFYGESGIGNPPVDKWNEGYGVLAYGFLPREVVNISTRTKVTTLPKDYWRNYIVKEQTPEAIG
jgi:hypothetical protein